MTNEELALLVQTGNRDKLVELWNQTKRLVFKKSSRWVGLNGTTIEDMLQSGFIAMMLAANDFDPSKGTKFTTHLGFRLRAELSAAAGWSTKRSRLDPLQNAISLDAPLEDAEGTTLADYIPDPAAAAEMENADIRVGMAGVLSELPEEQQRAVRDKYWHDVSVDQKVLKAAIKRLRLVEFLNHRFMHGCATLSSSLDTARPDVNFWNGPQRLCKAVWRMRWRQWDRYAPTRTRPPKPA